MCFVTGIDKMDEFITFLHELFVPFGTISVRKMFGGYGVYHQGLMFALVADKQLYFKVDNISKEEFITKGLPAFEYQKGDKTIAMSYHIAPEEIYDDAEQAVYWAALAYEAAFRAKKPTSKP